MKTALLASYTKDEPLIRLGKLLTAHDWSLLGSAGTAKFLNENGIPCRDVAEIVGAPILGHRVVTLSREIHAGLLSRDEDARELEKLGIPRIDLVYVTLYPLEETIRAGGTSHDVIEKTDIGGPTLLRAAAKGRRIVLSSPEQIDDASKLIQGEADEHLLNRLVAAAERRCAEYIG
ncbi:bifunctional phosphoribosylaminoimidazolecarboxamide formyltransferase/IMP cyclohydrolase, partial [Candidatus Uhrbacteria bacterium]|nr:bifunctional phosphoribosylaminoimidazolecarboxamide formyltransferase/IMP cyclohydrolase [Candidatus Uhrbacteria bacterium]